MNGDENERRSILSTPEHPKVFISHASEDKDRFVRQFAHRLVKRGLNPFYDEWDVPLGDDLIDKIFQGGLGTSDTVIVVLSPNSVNKPWVREEVDVAFVRRITKKVRLIPVIIEKCEIPVVLQHLKHITIKNLDAYDSELDAILSAIFGLNARPMLGDVPAHANASVQPIQGLSRGDCLVLKIACEMAIQENSDFLNPENLWKRVEPLEISRDEMQDSLEIMAQMGYIKPHRGGNRMLAFKILTLGFMNFLIVNTPKFEEMVERIVAYIVNEQSTSASEISEKSGIDRLTVLFVVRALSQQGHFALHEYMEGSTAIGGIKPSLKRLIQ